MRIHPLTRHATISAALGLAALTGGLALSTGTAAAYDSDTTKISCSAVKVHKSASKSSTAVGVAYKGDKMVYNQWAYKKSEKTWYTRGKITRRSDGAKISGYVLYQCANPYGTNGAPTPKKP
ncbi:hypothetical protein AB0904_22100 [Streptomyces sp. NPDC006684]|uniref:hypothetical protein n=1 Tax=Streptomyces sp. NPDC006684 TaxID=3154477 RepID=UPI00345590E5